MLTKLIELPSKGMYYSRAHPSHQKQVIEVKLFTAKEEDLITDETLARTGETINALFDSIIVDKTIRHQTLLSGDRNAILMKSRQFSLGSRYTYNWQCNCGRNNKGDILLDSLKYKNVPTRVCEPVFDIVLPSTGKLVKFKLLNGFDQDEVRRTEANRKKAGLPPAMVSTRLVQMIISIDGNDNKGQIQKFVIQMPSRDAKRLRSEYAKKAPDVNTDIVQTCNKCGLTKTMSLPLTAGFFRGED